MRAIDADALIEKCGDWYVEEGTESGFIGTLENLLATQPTIQHEPHWIPVAEGLPKKSGSYQVTTTHGKVATYVFGADSISSHEYWKRCVTAWRELPKPYKGVTE